MADEKQITELYGIQLKPRVMIKPKAAPIDWSTPEGKAKGLRTIREVIAEHRDVLKALAKR
jgi:hypothetical protein